MNAPGWDGAALVKLYPGGKTYRRLASGDYEAVDRPWLDPRPAAWLANAWRSEFGNRYRARVIAS